MFPFVWCTAVPSGGLLTVAHPYDCTLSLCFLLRRCDGMRQYAALGAQVCKAGCSDEYLLQLSVTSTGMCA